MKKVIFHIKNMPYLLLSLAPLFWGGNIVLGKSINQMIPPVSLAFWRWMIALIILLPFTWKQTKKDLPVAVKSWKILSILAFLGITCFNTMLYRAVHTTTAINGALIQSTMPAMIILITLTFFKEKVSIIQFIGLTLSAFGAVVIVFKGSLAALLELKLIEGDLLMIIAVFLYALYSVLLRKRPKINDLSFVTITFALGIIFLFPLYIWEFLNNSFDLNWQLVLSILYVAICPSILSYLCWNRGIQLIGANRGGLFINLIPVYASLLAVLLIGESLFLFHLTGMILIAGGIFLFNRKKREKVTG